MAPIDPDLLLRAYSMGVFPMSDSRRAKDVFWVEPRRRAILPLDGFRLSRSLAKTIRSDRFDVSRDTAFADVVRLCAEREETWINRDIEESFNRLHALGHAHSIECWREGRLAGGLYGLKLGRAFFGESMFSLERDASKVALAWLVARLKAGGFRLLDCQFMTPHLAGLGATEISQADYVVLLSAALGVASGDDPLGDAARARAGEPPEPPPEFALLDRLLSPPSAASVPAPGCVIAQLLGHTS
jgi:leucyl/phenylalanyl-tRNA--protein transferase